jgi:hypothetical protein
MHWFWSIEIPDTFSFDMDAYAHRNAPGNLPNMEPLPGKNIERADEWNSNGEELTELRLVPLTPASQPGSPHTTLTVSMSML